MILIQTIILVALALVMGGTGTFASSSYGEPKQTYLDKGGTRVQMTLSANRPLVLTWINGNGPHWFLVDTGSTATLVGLELAKEIGLKPVRGDTQKHGFAEGAMLRGCHIDSLGIGTARFDGISALVTDQLPPSSEGEKIRGVLGMPLFARCLLKIDYPARELTLTEGSLPFPDNKTVLGYAAEIGRKGTSQNHRAALPLIQLPIGEGGKEQMFLVDTGFSQLVAAAEWSFRGEFPGEPISTFSPNLMDSGATSESLMKMARLPGTLALGHWLVRQPPVRLEELKGAFKLGFWLLGGELLRAFSVTFDSQNQRMALEGPTHEGKPGYFDYSKSSIQTRSLPVTREPEYWSVQSDCTFADGNQIRKGDKLLYIMDVPVSSVSGQQLQDWLKDQPTLPMTLERNGATLTLRPHTVLLPPAD